MNSLEKQHEKHQNANHVTQKAQHFLSAADICPVETFLWYMSKLNPNLDDLWQRPKKIIKNPYKPWYDNAVQGRDPLNDTMKNLSKNAGLSQIYTNHCIRATVMEILDEDLHEARHIMAHSGHKSESSIKQYARRCPPAKRRAIAKSLAKRMIAESKEYHENDEQPPAKKASAAQGASTENPQIENPPVLQPIEINENFNNAGEAMIKIPLDAEIQEFNPEADALDDDQILQALEKIEKENQHLFVPENPNANAVVPQNAPVPGTSQNSIHVANVSNISNILNREQLPVMYFPGSTVTINYNFTK